MSWVHVQNGNHANSGTSTSIACSLASTVTVGHLIVVELSVFTFASPTIGVADSLGNTYTRAAHFVGGVQNIDIWYTVVTSGGASATITATIGSSNFLNINADEYAVSGTISVSGTATNTSTSSAPTTGTITVTGNCLVVGAAAQTGSLSAVPFTVGSGFTQRSNNNFVSGTTVGFCAEDQLNVTSSLAATWTMAGTTAWQAAGAAFSVSAAAVIVPIWHLVMGANTGLRDTP